ncbi:hypothetical protein HG537_0C02930 [Torulaspora globosa]|uniref:Chromatin modification-related protein EAF7 n=1 Tax=Torulaspora globosa TaxID=48254 RepID=A0A7H9HR17_9SACH|nr:hypothetical protein HG537_0C02930 [Torulaspora sp. CBS 2947]
MAFEWSVVDEIRLYRWVAEFKPAGMNKHFHMVCILERMNDPDKYPVILLQKEAGRPVKVFTAKEVWAKLGSAYNLAEIDRIEDQEIEQSSASDESREGLRERIRRIREVRDFELPWDEYGELILENARNGVEETGTAEPKRRSTRIRQSQRLKRSRPNSDDDADSSDVEIHEAKPTERSYDEDNAGTSADLPLAKRTRHSSQTRTSETSPKRKKRAEPPPAPTRVSSRLRNRKQ